MVTFAPPGFVVVMAARATAPPFGGGTGLSGTTLGGGGFLTGTI